MMSFRTFNWVDSGQGDVVSWWVCEVGLTLGGKDYDWTVIREDYFDDTGDAKGEAYRVLSSEGEVLYNGLWSDGSQFGALEPQRDWKIGEEDGLEVWLRLESVVENDNGWGFWDVEAVSEDYLKGLTF